MTALFVVAIGPGCALPVGGTASPVPTGQPGTAPSSSNSSGTPSTPTDPPLFAPSVQDPKDARGIAACDLLTDDQLRILGLIPESAESTSTSTTGRCTWSSAVDDTNPAGLEVLVDAPTAPLDFIYRLRESSAVWEELVIAGHPAVRENQYDDNSCTINVAISDYQAVSTEGNPALRDLPDPCAVSRGMAEFVLSNLPPLR